MGQVASTSQLKMTASYIVSQSKHMKGGQSGKLQGGGVTLFLLPPAQPESSIRGGTAAACVS